MPYDLIKAYKVINGGGYPDNVGEFNDEVVFLSKFDAKLHAKRDEEITGEKFRLEVCWLLKKTKRNELCV